jgi:EAL domain-containing protein (putative c-di-GMP-specific phosphodiesterase class I)
VKKHIADLPGAHSARHHRPVSEKWANIRFAFQPLINLRTGGVMAMEMLARLVHRDVQSLLRCAARTGGLEQLDVTLAVAAARCSSEH